MKVKDLINDLKVFDPEAEIFLIKDCDEAEGGILTDRYRLIDVFTQKSAIDMGMYFDTEQQVLLCFEEERW